MTTHLRTFTLPEFLAEVNLEPLNERKSSAQEGNASFRGTNTFAEALELARNGWPAGLEAVNRARELVKVPEGDNDFRIVPTFADEGDEVAVDRFLEGETDCWITFPTQDTPRSGRVVQVVVDACASCGVKVEEIAAKGAAALALVDALEARGLRVELIIGASAQKDETIWDVRVLLKRAEDVLELDRLAFFLTHAATLRRLFFRAWERLPNFSKTGQGYGHPRPYIAAAEHFNPGAIILPSGIGRAGFEAAAAQVSKILEDWTAQQITPGA